jgi:hypothetical protein
MDISAADSYSILALLLHIFVIGSLLVGIIYLFYKIFMDTSTTAAHKISLVKTLYLYLVSFVALMLMVFSSVDLLSTVLKTFIFTKADTYLYYTTPTICTPGATTTYDGTDCATAQKEAERNDKLNQESSRERDLVRDISMLIVTLPLFAFHWRLARRKDS